ncbi:MAG: type II secretion system ATPase GspE [Bacillota bacterium]
MNNRERQLIGQLFLQNGCISAADLDMALEMQKSKKIPIAQILVQMGVINEKDLADVLAQQLGLMRWRPDAEEPAREALEMISYDVAQRYRVLPLYIQDGQLMLAVKDPFDGKVIDELGILTGYGITPVMATDDEIGDAIEKYYRTGAQSVLNVLKELQEQTEPGLDENLADLASLEEIANEAPVVRLVNLIIMEAVKARASDIHLEPFEDEVQVRYRIDGLLYATSSPPKRLYPAIISRIKLMAGMDIAERRLPQDGRITINVGDATLDLRVAVAPSKHGEFAVLRILNRQNFFMDLEQLGFDAGILKDFLDLLQHPHGAVLVTGPTGSGKTTTLYAALSKLNSPQRKIITIEDPIEYEMKGINQMQVNPKIDFTFARGLRTIVRHDPDVILVGEIRDLETAEVAIQSSLTGHLVFTTLHTNDAPGAITRLLDMGVEEFLVASTVRGVLAQRLVRVICPSCKDARKPTRQEKAAFDLPAGAFVYYGKGCDACNNIGYLGRTGIYELMLMDEEIEGLIMERKNSSVIKAKAVEKGMITLFQSGREKILQGVTTVDEVLMKVTAS